MQPYDVCAAFFAALCFGLVFYKPVHTGVFGSFGLVMISLGTIFSIDDNLYKSINNIQTCFGMFMLGASLVIIHVLRLVHKAARKHPEGLAHGFRRASDLTNGKVNHP